MRQFPPEYYASFALELGERTLAIAAELPDGSLSWGRGFGVGGAPCTDSGIFNGRLGEALLFGALANASGLSTFSAAAECITAPMRQCLATRDGTASIVRNQGIGLMGLGSMLFGLVWIGIYLESRRIKHDVETAITNLSLPAFLPEASAELTWGLAGLTLGLLTAGDHGVAAAVELAVVCGKKILEQRVVDPVSGFRVWKTIGGDLSAGFAHGCTGIAHALLALHRRTYEHQFYDAAMETFSFERSLYCEESGDWPDNRMQRGPYLRGWCHGAAGIGLSRVSALGVLRNSDKGDIAHDLYLTLQRITSLRCLGDVDNLCCGGIGMAEFLLEAGRCLPNPLLVEAAKDAVEAIVDRARERGSFKLPVYQESHLQPGMWQGLTGVAFTLLRFSDPDHHPCLLRLE